MIHYLALFWTAVVLVLYIRDAGKLKKRIKTLQEELAAEEREGEQNGSV